MRSVARGAVVMVLAVGMGALPVVSFPAPQAHAVAPDVSEIDVDGVDDDALTDPTVLDEVTDEGVDGDDAAQPQDPEDTATTTETDDPAAEPADEPQVEGAAGEVSALTPLTTTQHFLVAGVTWDEEADSADVVEVAVRVLDADVWSDWTALEVEDLEIDGERPGTAPLVTGGSDGIQARIVTASGQTPAGARIDVVDPGTSAADGASSSQPAASADAATGDEIRPSIVTRAKWGADERRGSSWPDVSADLKAMFVHHTAGTNSYTKAQSPAIVRGIYAYHTGSRDWPDIGYQFLVDKYGTIYQGRRDALQDLPIGAQVGGFNTETIGVSAMGNFETAQPSSALVTSIERVLAWEAFRHGLNATGSVTLTGGGSTSRYDPGSRVSVKVISGHRNTSYTTCPGKYLYAKLSGIRSDVKSRVSSATSRYGAAKSTVWGAQPGATPITLGPAQLPYSATYRWTTVPGAVKYKVYVRGAYHGSASPDSRAWATYRTQSGTSVVLKSPAGYTRSVAVRPIDSGGRLGPLTVVRTSTRPLELKSIAFTSSFSKVKDSKYLWGSAMRSTSSTASVAVKNVRSARQVVIIGPTSPSKGRLQVVAGGKVVATVSMASSPSVAQGQRIVKLPSSTSGTIQLRSVDKGKEVLISAIAFPRTAPVPTTPARPGVNQLSTSYSPVNDGTSTPLRWAASSGAIRYDVYMRKSTYKSKLPSSWTKIASTSTTAYTASSSSPGGVYVFGVRAVGRSGTSSIATYYSVARPVSSNAWKLSTGSRGWLKVKDSRYYRGYVYRSSATGSTLTIPDAVDVRRVRVMGKAGTDSGAVDVYVGGKRYGSISLHASKTVDRRAVDLILPSYASGDVVLRTTSSKPVKISAVTLAHR